MMYESAPVPLPAGALEPPRRRPPTAVGTLEQPPRRPRRSRYRVGPSLLRRVALRGLAMLFLVGGTAVLWPLSWQSSVGASLLSLSVHVAHRSLGPEGGSRFDDVGEASPDVSAESREGSA